MRNAFYKTLFGVHHDPKAEPRFVGRQLPNGATTQMASAEHPGCAQGCPLFDGPLRGHGFDMGMIFAKPHPMQAGLHGFAHPAKYDFRVAP